MSAEFAVRLAQIHDAQQITSLYSELDQYHARLLPTYFKELATARDSAGIAAGLAGKAEQIFVAEPRHEPVVVVGFIQVLERIVPESVVSRPRHVAQIEALVVTPAARRGGVARALVGAAEQWARERGLAGIELNVWAGNQLAVDAYNAMGFETLSYRLFRTFKS